MTDQTSNASFRNQVEDEAVRKRLSPNKSIKEFKTLAYLIKNPRRVISRDELLNDVWG
jgi:DNA-binding response OmpR family regulator